MNNPTCFWTALPLKCCSNVVDHINIAYCHKPLYFPKHTMCIIHPLPRSKKPKEMLLLLQNNLSLKKKSYWSEDYPLYFSIYHQNDQHIYTASLPLQAKRLFFNVATHVPKSEKNDSASTKLSTLKKRGIWLWVFL